MRRYPDRSDRRSTRLLQLIIALLFALGTTLGGLPRNGASVAEADNGPIVLAMYYAWFDGNSWDPGRLSDRPTQPYSSADRGTIERQVRQAKSAGIDAFALNWWGPNNPTDSNLQMLLSVANAEGFKVTIDFDLNSPFVKNAGDITNFLSYAARYYSDPAWLRLNGKPLITFYGIRKYDVGAWGAIRGAADPNHAATWIGEGDIFSYLSVFDGIHPYSIAWSPDPAGQLASYAARTRAYGDKIWMPTVMPGYDDTRIGRGAAGYSRARENGNFYRRTWEGALATRPSIINITSFNEWPEGSMIEPGVGYGDLYLRITKEYSDRAKGIGVPAPAPAPAPAPSGDGMFFTEAGSGKGGFLICNDGGIGFMSSFQALGGVGALGFPSSQRYKGADGFNYQATQGALLQWRPEYGRALLANTFEILSSAGKDEWLDQARGIPRPIVDDGSGGDWNRAKETRLSWLTDPAIKAKYLSAGSIERAIELYGLPMSKPEKRGPFIVQRFQRIAFQNWVESVPGMPAVGSVVRVLGGDLLKETGLIPAGAVQATAR